MNKVKRAMKRAEKKLKELLRGKKAELNVESAEDSEEFVVPTLEELDAMMEELEADSGGGHKDLDKFGLPYSGVSDFDRVEEGAEGSSSTGDAESGGYGTDYQNSGVLPTYENPEDINPLDSHDADHTHHHDG